MTDSRVTPSPPNTLELPLLPRRDIVLFPKLVSQLLAKRQSSVQAIETASARNIPLVVVARRTVDDRRVTMNDIFSVGTIAAVGRVLKMPEGLTSLWIQGERRVRILEITQSTPYYKALVAPLDEPVVPPASTKLLMRTVLALFEKVVKLSGNLPDEVFTAAANVDEPGWLADLVCSYLELSIPQRQEVLEVLNPEERLQRVSSLVAYELEMVELQSKIRNKAKDEMERSQREYFLREQMRAIQDELDESEPGSRDMKKLRRRIEAAGMPQEAKKKAIEEMERLEEVHPNSPELSVIRTYIDWLVALPWKKETKDNLDIKEAARVLDENHYGLPRVKERILEYIAVRKLAEDKHRSPLLCFVGAPGVGKTSLGMSIAKALGRKFVRISLGGIRDEAEIRGHRRTYVGALPGRILQVMKNAGTINPVFMLDEIDKVGTDFRGDPSSALLEVLDPEQNHSFSDHYLEVSYDLSKVLFIATANLLEPVIPALRDRLEVIEISGYTEDEKLEIARRFLISKQLKECGLKEDHLDFSTRALRNIIREHTHEAGVRNLEREIGSICRKIAKKIASGEKAPRIITTQALALYLGPQKFFWGTAEEQDEIGVAMGVARTEMGGDVLGIEVSLLEGKGSLMLTGQLGDVMKESAQAALSYARTELAKHGLRPKQLEKLDVHIHVPAGAVPKDGPSAGITMATALISAFLKRPVRKEVAMTGEITLRGRVLPVGGIKEKTLAVHRAGITTFVLPSKNKKDLNEIPSHVRRDLHFIFVDSMDDVLKQALKDGETKGPVPPVRR